MDEHRHVAEKLIDPSSLTTAQLQREIASLKELLLTHIDRIDKAVEVAHHDLVRVPTDFQKEISDLKELQHEKFNSINSLLSEKASLRDEKFSSVEKQFKDRDIRIEQTGRDSKLAADAALQAAKDLVQQQNIYIAQASNKQEASFAKQIDQQAMLIVTTTKSLEDKINDLKGRLISMEGQSSGKKDFWGYIIGAIGMIATIGTIVAFLISMKK